MGHWLYVDFLNLRQEEHVQNGWERDYDSQVYPPLATRTNDATTTIQVATEGKDSDEPG
jgi:hypothetical protein